MNNGQSKSIRFTMSIIFLFSFLVKWTPLFDLQMKADYEIMFLITQTIRRTNETRRLLFLFFFFM